VDWRSRPISDLSNHEAKDILSHEPWEVIDLVIKEEGSMISKEFFSTGEAAQLLNVSRSTISRRFDLGSLSGKRNPITGDRWVSRESIWALMKLHNVPLEALAPKKKVLVSTSNDNLFSFLQQAFWGDERLEVDRLGLWVEVLRGCPKECPDLLILDEESQSPPSLEVIRSLRMIEELKDLRIICLSKSPDAHRYVEMGADEGWTKESIDKGGLRKRLYKLLDLPEIDSKVVQPFEHLRRWPRFAIHLPANIWVYRLRTPYRRDPGEAQMENISCGGALLSGIHLERDVLPCEPFRIFMKVDQTPLKNWHAHCMVVRLQSNDRSLGAGVQFTRLPKASLKIIEAISQP